MDKLPVEILLNIFSYLPTLEDGFRCSCVCRSWFHVLNSDSEVWEQLLVTSTPKEYHSDPLLNKLDSAKAKLIAFHCAWSSEDHSHNIRLNTNKLTLHRDPVAQSSDGIRGKRGFTRGVHYWTVTWHGPKFGSSSVVGVATKEASLQDSGYYALIGCDKESWGWDISQNVLRHDGVVLQDYPNSGVKVSECIVSVNFTCYRIPGYEKQMSNTRDSSSLMLKAFV